MFRPQFIHNAKQRFYTRKVDVFGFLLGVIDYVAPWLVCIHL